MRFKAKSSSAQGNRVVVGVIAIICLFALIAFPFACRSNQKRQVEAQTNWERNADEFTAIIFNQLKSYCLSQTNFPALSVEELHQRGIIDDQSMAFLKLSKVHFYPFSSADPDDRKVLSVLIAPGIKWSIPSRGKTLQFPPESVDLTKGDILNTNINYGGMLDLNTYR